MKRSRVSAAFAVISLATLSAVCQAGLGPENIMVVVNADSPASLQIANEYLRIRGIPASHVVMLHHLTGTEYVDVDHFRSDILKPTLEAIQSRGLTQQIDCITYSADIPYSVNVGSDIKGRPMPMVITQPAAINGLTYLYDWVLKGDIDYLRLDINRYSRRILPLPAGLDMTPAEQIDYAKALNDYANKKYEPAIVALKKLLDTPRTDPNIAYNLACCQALVNQTDDAVKSLRLAMRAGWRNYGQTASDPDLASLANNDEFKKVLRLLKGVHIDVQPSFGFHQSVALDRSGNPAITGSHYMLSTVLGVTAGRGNSVDDILTYLRRSKQADFTSPKGTIYFERNGDVRSRTREWGFQPAADALAHMGIQAVVEDGVLPQNRADVAGATIGTAGFDWPASHSTILPGAILEHLTSFGGMLNKGADQTPCTEFLKNGASGSSGTVMEPYALQEKFPTPFIHVEYAKGFTLAEAFYLSVSGPYQLLMLGDPLTRPWGTKASITVGGLPANSLISKPTRFQVNLNSAAKPANYSLYVDGKLLQTTPQSNGLVLDPKKLEAGYHDASITAVLNDVSSSVANYPFNFMIPIGTNKFVTPLTATTSLSNKTNFVVSAPGASDIELFAHGESIYKIIGDKGSVSIAGSSLGLGTIALYPVATFRTGSQSSRLRGQPIQVTVTN